MGPVPEHQTDLTVASLLLADGSDWNREAIQQYFPQEEERILMIKPRPLAPWIIWSLWTAKNKLAFENKASTPEDVISNAIGTA
ncbi:hypothetical protein DY000_02002107 [Brassica cretica]|uniref:Uncharacterized protein n=1 Tax=Brassica cretica TaxID=69181 RepID=A0ABQ7C8X9_BRACR|nr:hypothetical protein DY000_02002107 [Brassica cretica]